MPRRIDFVYICLIAAQLTGCQQDMTNRSSTTKVSEFPPAPPGHYYKLKARPAAVGPAWDIGTPTQIADWALGRTDVDSIRDAIHALILKEHEGLCDDFYEALEAKKAILRINQTLALGWPGLNAQRVEHSDDGKEMIVPLTGDKQEYVDGLFRSLYHLVASTAYDLPHNSEINHLFEMLRPPNSEPKRLEIWQEGERIRLRDKIMWEEDHK